MNLRRRITRTLLAALPAVEQQRLVNDFVDWLYSDLPPDDRRIKAERLAPLLLECITESRVSLWLVLLQHLMRLPLLRAFDAPSRSRPIEVRPARLETGVERSGQ